MTYAGGVQRAEHRPGAVDVIHAPAPVPRALGKLGTPQIFNSRRDRPAALGGLSELSQHRDAARGDVLGRRIEQRPMIRERDVIEIVFEIVDVEGGPTAIAALHALDPLAAASDGGVV